MGEHNVPSTVLDLMAGFAERTGLTSDRPPRRYLWTDAFAVCNYLGLYAATGDERYRDLAVRLVDQVHHVLGRHQPSAARAGWLSGLEGQAAELHPTAGGLRIGKTLPERPPDERFDPQLEWDRDGQYFHYLTRWMHALSRTGRVLADPAYNRWAVELAERVHAAFTYQAPTGGPPRLVWKMSVDLSRPLVPTMGHHDPLDGYISYLELAAASPEPRLGAEIDAMEEMIWGRDWTTDDPLGNGGLLSDAYRLAQLIAAGRFQHADLVLVLLESALLGLTPALAPERSAGASVAYERQGASRLPASARLAFRELGLAIGLHAGERLAALLDAEPGPFDRQALLRQRLQSLAGHLPLAAQIESFWLDPANQAADTWTDHLDINTVMLATSLAPGGYLSL